MPEKPLTVATYAAGASLAAITLFYVFAPTYLIDNNTSNSKKGVVGLSNTANDCFINSVLQALAGLTDLRVYLIRETHRRNIDDSSVYRELVQDVQHPSSKPSPEWKLEGLQTGIVTKGLKEILDALNERPIYKKTISAMPFVKVLEAAFRQRISRQQQDAQEFLQIVAERLCDEYHAGRRARRAARRKGSTPPNSTGNSLPANGNAVEERLAGLALTDGAQDQEGSKLDNAEEHETETVNGVEDHDADEEDDEEGFPLEGKMESQIECQRCGFKPKATQTTFCTLTLSVPQVGSVALNTCLDGFFKTEYIDDFRCEKCQLMYAKEQLEHQAAKSSDMSFKKTAEDSIAKIQIALETDPETRPEVVFPDMQNAPKSKIARHTRITEFPKIMSIHLSRSIYDASHSSQKNSAKVSFPERLPLGGLLQQKKYRLLGTVMHKGSHNSGHYESFRRQNTPQPFSTTNTFHPGTGVFTPSVAPSPAMTPQAALTPQMRAVRQMDNPSPADSTPDLLSQTSGYSTSSNPSSSAEGLPRDSVDAIPRSSPTANGQPPTAPFSPKARGDPDAISLRSVAASAKSTVSRFSHSVRHSRSGSPMGKHPSGNPRNSIGGSGQGDDLPIGRKSSSATSHFKPSMKPSRRKKQPERWWRISDEKVKEAKTSEVLGMQREVYLLFYELERENGPLAAAAAAAAAAMSPP